MVLWQFGGLTNASSAQHLPIQPCSNPLPLQLQRNIVLKQFRGIPLADLEMVMPEKRVSFAAFAFRFVASECNGAALLAGSKMCMPEKRVNRPISI